MVIYTLRNLLRAKVRIRQLCIVYQLYTTACCGILAMMSPMQSGTYIINLALLLLNNRIIVIALNESLRQARATGLVTFDLVTTEIFPMGEFYYRSGVNTLLGPNNTTIAVWKYVNNHNVCMYICMYICMYVYMCMYVCMYVITWA